MRAVVTRLRRLAAAARRVRNPQLWLGCLAGAIVIVLLIGSTVLSHMQLGRKTIYAEFAQAAGLSSGDSVDVAGIQVGVVGGMRIEGDHVLASLRVDSDVALGPDARATVELSTILGRMHVVLHPGNHKGLPDNRIRIANTTVPYNLAKVVIDPEYQSQFQHLEGIDPKLLRSSLDVLSNQMGTNPQLTVDAINSVGTLASVINTRTDQVNDMLKGLDTVSRLVADNQNSVLRLLTQGEDVANAVQVRQALLTELLNNIASMSKQLQQMGVDNKGQLGPLIQHLDEMATGLTKNSANLNRLFQIAPPAIRQLNNSLGNGPYADVYVPWGFFPDNWVCLVHAVEGCN